LKYSAAAFLRNHRYAVDQILGAGNHYFVSGLYAIEDYIVVAHDLAIWSGFWWTTYPPFWSGSATNAK